MTRRAGEPDTRDYGTSRQITPFVCCFKRHDKRGAIPAARGDLTAQKFGFGDYVLSRVLLKSMGYVFCMISFVLRLQQCPRFVEQKQAL